MTLKGRPRTAKWTVRVCECCGKSWEAPPYSKQNLLYCSRACWKKGIKGKPRGPYVEPEERECALCGTSFLVGGFGNKPRRSTFCSVKCAVDGRWVGMPGHSRPRQLTPEEAAWFGGLFDGDGNICWPRPENMRSIRLSMTNTCHELLVRVQEITGTGKIFDRSKHLKSDRHSPVWVWACQGENARMILPQIHKWLIAKKHSCDVALGIVHADKPPATQRTLTARSASK